MRCGGGGRPSDAEVHHLDRAVQAEHHVRGLDVPVDDPHPVAVVERGAHVGGDFHGPALGEAAFALEHVTQGAALHVLHHDIRDGHAVDQIFAGVVDGHDGWMVERRGRLRFAPEPGQEGLITREISAQRLDRDLASEPHIATTVNLGHTTVTEDLTQLVALTHQARFGPEHLSHACHPYSPFRFPG